MTRSSANTLFVASVLYGALACGADSPESAVPAPADGAGKADTFGPDDRTSVSESVDPRAAQWASSTALLSARTLDGVVPTLQERFDLCSDEPFLDEPFIGHCTGFLVAPGLLATAGHCLEQHPCERTQIVFGVNDIEGNGPPFVDPEAVFRCVAVHHSAHADVALVELDRDTQRPALPLGSVVEDQGIALVGHGLGSTATVDLAGEASEVSTDTFRTSLDTFSGHSGSPVIAMETGEVVGVHTSGSGYSVVQRFEADCHEFARCEGDHCTAGAVRVEALPFGDAGLSCPDSLCD